MTTALPDDWWTTENVAAFIGVAPSTVRSYVARSQMPRPDRSIGRTWVWMPDTIKTWQQSRPRQPTSDSPELHALQ